MDRPLGTSHGSRILATSRDLAENPSRQTSGDPLWVAVRQPAPGEERQAARGVAYVRGTRHGEAVCSKQQRRLLKRFAAVAGLTD